MIDHNHHSETHPIGTDKLRVIEWFPSGAIELRRPPAGCVVIAHSERADFLKLIPVIAPEAVERLAVHLLSEWRGMAELPPVAALDNLTDFAKDEWRAKARKLLDIAFGAKTT